ncbi:MAG: phosphoribosylamine--glycine ligase [Oscillospiraceae bacterium]|nr:phosphoribosylamine--glycine ligase [Oscillospiraceae bacterium]
MKLLLIGGGGREHAIAWKLSQSRHMPELFVAPGNAGIAQIATCLPYPATDLDGICSWAESNKPDLVFVAPDDPLALGLVDKLEALGIPAFGPRANAAILEGSKVFSKAFMQKHGIPTAKYQTFDDQTAALAYLETQSMPVVIKADGLALGKGVIIAQTEDEARDAVISMMSGGRFGASGNRVVIEECMTGPEVTVLAFTDGATVKAMPSSQDHKRAFDGDQGPNTGGMGAICPSPHYTPDIAAICERDIFLPTIQGMATEGRPFKGVIYFGLMLTPDGPKVIEYNARFGDPEAQAILPLLDSDLVDICLAIIDGKLADCPIAWRKQASVCIVMASGGYPGDYPKGFPITGLDDVQDAIVFHAGTANTNGQVVTNGGRVLGITALGENMPEALAAAYTALRPIAFEGAFFRTDIGRL